MKTFNNLTDKLLADGGTNSCVSPLSFKFALAMAYNGAVGDTAELLSELFGRSPGELNAWAGGYLADAAQYDGSQDGEYSLPSPELRIANSFWVRQGLEKVIAKDFTDTLTADFTAEIGKFDKKPDTINNWVSDATNGKIKDILAGISPGALSYIVNALYFKAQWIDAFDEKRTTPGAFTNSDGYKTTTDMLHGHADRYINTKRFEGVTKHLSGDFEFTAVMPKTNDTVTLESILKAKTDDRYTAINLTLPKFDLETRFDIKEGSLPEFNALFAPNGMDGALSEHAKTDGLSISRIIHKTTFTLAEVGIEASAATVIEQRLTGMPQKSKVVHVVFDKPFYFMLSDRSGEVLFVGKVANL
jgi:serpin B